MPHVTKEFLERVIASDQHPAVDIDASGKQFVRGTDDGPLAAEARSFKDKEGWVSVSERLPEFGAKRIVVADGCRMIGQFIGGPPHSPNHWATDLGAYGDRVTHWLDWEIPNSPVEVHDTVTPHPRGTRVMAPGEVSTFDDKRKLTMVTFHEPDGRHAIGVWFHTTEIQLAPPKEQ